MSDYYAVTKAFSVNALQTWVVKADSEAHAVENAESGFMVDESISKDGDLIEEMSSASILTGPEAQNLKNKADEDDRSVRITLTEEQAQFITKVVKNNGLGFLEYVGSLFDQGVSAEMEKAKKDEHERL